MPTANQNFTLDGRDFRVGDTVDVVPPGLDRLFDEDPDDDQEGDV